VVIDEDGNVQTVCDQPVFGIIKDLAVLPWNDKFRACRPQVCVMAISKFDSFIFSGSTLVG
jgi:hypothetical protein